MTIHTTVLPVPTLEPDTEAPRGADNGKFGQKAPRVNSLGHQRWLARLTMQARRYGAIEGLSGPAQSPHDRVVTCVVLQS